jgi:hypothetical protein
MPLQDLFIASFQYGSAAAWEARHGLSSNDYQTAFNQNAAKGFRLRCVSGYAGADGASRYAAIWDNSPGGSYVGRHGLTPQQYQQSFRQLTALGFRPRIVNAHAIGGQESYACFFEKAAGAPWAARHGLDGAEYQRVFSQWTQQGYVPRWLSVHAVSGTLRYACIFEKATIPPWVARHGLTEDEFRAAHGTLAAQGYDLVCGNGASVGGTDFYCGIWEQRPAATIMHHGMTRGTYQQKFDEFTANGYFPLFISGYSGEDPVDVRLRFSMQQQRQANWCWAAVSSSVDEYYKVGSTLTQCQIANSHTGQTNCCSAAGSSAPCNAYGYLDQTLGIVGHFDRMTQPSTFDEVEKEMVAGRPLGIRVAWSGGGAHFIAATGTEDDGSVWVSDPGSGTTSLVPFNTLRSSYLSSGTWTHSYFTKP